MARRPARVTAARYGSSKPLDEGIDLIPADDGILRSAAELAPTTLKALDAIHVATAISVREDLAAFVAYDDRSIMAARRHGLEVRSPGRRD